MWTKALAAVYAPVGAYVGVIVGLEEIGIPAAQTRPAMVYEVGEVEELATATLMMVLKQMEREILRDIRAYRERGEPVPFWLEEDLQEVRERIEAARSKGG